jgi:hypothetical protein
MFPCFGYPHIYWSLRRYYTIELIYQTITEAIEERTLISGWNICTYGWICINPWTLKNKCNINTIKPISTSSFEKKRLILYPSWHTIREMQQGCCP